MTRPPTDAARDVLVYFLRHQQAADDAEGIARFRLLEQTVRDVLGETDAALEWLVAEGYLTQVDVPGRPPIFRLNEASVRRAQAFVRGEGAEP